MLYDYWKENAAIILHRAPNTSYAMPTQQASKQNHNRGELELELEGTYISYLYVQALEISIESPWRLQDTELEDVRSSWKRDFDLASLSASASRWFSFAIRSSTQAQLRAVRTPNSKKYALNTKCDSAAKTDLTTTIFFG